MKELKVCPSTLAAGYGTYSPVAIKRLFDGKRISHILPYDSPGKNEQDNERFIRNRERISVSGVQEKLSFIAEGGILRLTEQGETGTHILKPIPSDLKKAGEIPANENLTMQIASQVYGIETAANGLCFFRTGEPAYITRRFDVSITGQKLRVEDFASLAGKSLQTAGANFKYDYSYEELAGLIKRFIPAWRIEIEKFFALVLFNFLFSNGDAHLKNFSVIETSNGDFRLAPAYDLLNTHIHVDDSDFALGRGLFGEGERSPHLAWNGKANGRSFMEFAMMIGVNERSAENILAKFTSEQQHMELLVGNSFLDRQTQKTYMASYREKRNRLIDAK